MKNHVLNALALVATSLVSTHAFTQTKEGPWMLRARAVNLTSANTESPGLGMAANDIVQPELDVNYFFSPNVALELFLSLPKQHDVKFNDTKIGTLSQLPPSLLAQYHFRMNGFKPYVGAGVNYTRFATSKISIGSLAATMNDSTWGSALQAGVDIPVSRNMYLNFDVKKILVKTPVNYQGNSIGTLKVDPLLISVGLDWRFY